MAAGFMAADSGTLGSVVNELGENEFGDSDLVGNAVVVKLLMVEGMVEVIGGVRQGTPGFRARRQPASG